MTIYQNSRYMNADIEFISLVEYGDANPVVFYEIPSIGQIDYFKYTWKSGDRLDLLAETFYKTPRKWWVIAEANPEIVDIATITAGTVIRIPHNV